MQERKKKRMPLGFKLSAVKQYCEKAKTAETMCKI
uniref:Uncharacterized protein n=1 Tax=Setaria italica TaxID=4555 RepID=K3XTM4_SETIT